MKAITLREELLENYEIRQKALYLNDQVYFLLSIKNDKDEVPLHSSSNKGYAIDMTASKYKSLLQKYLPEMPLINTIEAEIREFNKTMTPDFFGFLKKQQIEDFFIPRYVLDQEVYLKTITTLKSYRVIVDSLIQEIEDTLLEQESIKTSINVLPPQLYKSIGVQTEEQELFKTELDKNKESFLGKFKNKFLEISKKTGSIFFQEAEHRYEDFLKNMEVKHEFYAERIKTANSLEEIENSARLLDKEYEQIELIGQEFTEHA